MSFGFIILIIFGFFIFLLLIGVMFFYFYNKHGKTKDITTNKPLVMNFTEQGDNFIYTEEKTELKETGYRNNQVLCKDYEIEYDNDGNPKLPSKAFEPIIITTAKSRRLCFSRGTLSDDREIFMYLPENLNNIHDSFKSTRFYKLIEPLLLKNDALENTIKSYTLAIQRNKEVIQLLLSSNLDEQVIRKLRIMRQTLDDAERTRPEQRN